VIRQQAIGKTAIVKFLPWLGFFFLQAVKNKTLVYYQKGK